MATPSAQPKTWSIAQIRDLYLQLWPEGQLYDWANPSSWVSRWLDVVAQTLQTFVYAVLEELKAEVVPDQIVQKIPDWFEAFGMQGSSIAHSASVSRQRAAIISRLRESGGFDFADVQAIVAPLLGYSDPTTLVVLDDNWDQVDPTFTYGDSAPNPQRFTHVVPYVRELWIYDGGTVNAGDIRVRVMLTTAALETVSIRVTSPTGKFRVWSWFGSGAVATKELWLRGGGDGGRSGQSRGSQERDCPAPE